jgi:S-adenosylmethionine synthetase
MLFTSESDAILDAMLAQNSESRVAYTDIGTYGTLAV